MIKRAILALVVCAGCADDVTVPSTADPSLTETEGEGEPTEGCASGCAETESGGVEIQADVWGCAHIAAVQPNPAPSEGPDVGRWVALDVSGCGPEPVARSLSWSLVGGLGVAGPEPVDAGGGCLVSEGPDVGVWPGDWRLILWRDGEVEDDFSPAEVGAAHDVALTYRRIGDFWEELLPSAPGC